MKKVYAYEPNKVLFIITILFFGGFAFLCINEALTIDKAVRIKGITIDVNMAKILFWIASALFLYISLLGIISIIKTFGSDREIILTKDNLITPKNAFSSTTLSIPLEKILQIKISTAATKEALNIKYTGGKVVIPETVFQSNQNFISFKSALSTNVTAIKLIS